jgi:ankyrin repeat protein
MQYVQSEGPYRAAIAQCKVRALTGEEWNVDGQDADGMTLLHTSCISNDSALLNLLIHKRADVNIVDNLGRTPLSLACHNDFSDIVPTLLREGADPFAGNELFDLPKSCARLISFHLARSGRCAACGKQLLPSPFPIFLPRLLSYT